jgi:adenylate cyclase
LRLPQLTPLRIALVLGFALAGVRLAGCQTLELLDTRAIDFRLLQRGEQPVSDEVVIVAIDDASIASQGRWPWSRPRMAQLLRQISAADPSVIAFDIVQSEATDAPNLSSLEGKVSPETLLQVRDAFAGEASDDRQLASAIRDAGNVVVGHYFDFSASEIPDEPQKFGEYTTVQMAAGGRGALQVPNAKRLVANIPEIASAALSSGYFNTLPDTGDGSYRRVPMVIAQGDRFALPLSLATLAIAQGTTPRIRFAPFGVQEIFLGSQSIPVAEDGQLLLNYRGKGYSFPHISAVDVLQGRVAPETLAGKIVLVGVTASAVADVRSTPLDGNYPGVEIHATALDNILRGDFLHQPRWTILVEVAAIFLSVFVLGLILRWARGVWGLVAVGALLVTYLGGSQALFLISGIPLGIVHPVVAIVLVYIVISVQHYMTEERQKRRTREAFGRYLNPEIADKVSENPDLLALGGERRELTVLFSDIRGFTTISEGLEPEALVELLNVYLGAMTDVIFEQDGTLDKYIGDAIMAVWGAPMPRPDHAAAACRAAIGMSESLAANTDDWQARGWPRLAAGIGVHTGDMIVGNMGSDRHVSYTVIGDNVNLGARLEGLTKNYGVEVIISEVTRAAAGDEFLTRELDLVAVKGKAEAARIYELMGTVGNTAKAEISDEFTAAMALYRAQRFAEALIAFEAMAIQLPDDKPTQIYVERSKQFIAEPPPADWNGVTVMQTK